MLNSIPKPTVTIYASGGAGVNIGYSLSLSSVLEKENIYCNFKIAYIDTSRKNFLGKNINIQEEAHIFDVDGAGQCRDAVYDYINNNKNDVFKKFPPTEINLFIFSTSGGSGSVICPVLARELVKVGKPVVLFGIESNDTLKHAKNSLATLGTLQAISTKLGKPIIFNHTKNIPGAIEDNVNKTVIFNVITTAILLSGAVDRIDTTDIANLLNYTKVSTQTPSLTGFNIVVSNDPLAHYVSPFAGLSIHRDEAVVPRADNLDFKKIGFLKDMPGNSDSIHFYLDKPSIQVEYDSLTKAVKDLEEISKSRHLSFNMSKPTGDDDFVF
jgi:hypothetical protein